MRYSDAARGLIREREEPHLKHSNFVEASVLMAPQTQAVCVSASVCLTLWTDMEAACKIQNTH